MTTEELSKKMADKYVKAELGQYNTRYQEAGRKDYAAGFLEGAPLQPGGGMEGSIDADFTLWVVVNKWKYNTERHKWFNNYIGELKNVIISHSDLYKLFKNKTNMNTQIKFGDMFVHVPSKSLHQCVGRDEGLVWYIPQGQMESKSFDAADCSKKATDMFV